MTTSVRVTPAGCSTHFADMVIWRIRLYHEGTGDPSLSFDIESSIADRYNASGDALAVRGIRVVSEWRLCDQRDATARVHCLVP